MISKYLGLVLLSFIFFSGNPDPGRFESEIEAFDSLNRVNPPAKGCFIFYGSSSIRMWKSLEDDFKTFPVVNRGFGGSQLSDALYYFDRVLVPWQPAKIILYEGDNDIATGKSPKKILNDLKLFYKMVHEKIPMAEVGILAAKPSPSRWDLKKKYEKTNSMLSKYCDMNESFTFIDVYNPMLLNGRPNPEYYIKDSLHMNAKGYELWTRLVKPFIEK